MDSIRKSDERHMRTAIRKASRGVKAGQTPFGACIVRAGKVVACEHNRVWADGDITAHAEINAIRAACRRLKSVDLTGCTVYSTCEPCPMCFSACHWARFERIVYGASIADARKAGFNELGISNRRMSRLGGGKARITSGVLRAECRRLLSGWSGRGGRAY